MVFQSYALNPHMTVRENLSFGLKLRAAPKSEIDGRITSVTEIRALASRWIAIPSSSPAVSGSAWRWAGR